jgi:hypothetical protein
VLLERLRGRADAVYDRLREPEQLLVGSQVCSGSTLDRPRLLRRRVGEDASTSELCGLVVALRGEAFGGHQLCLEHQRVLLDFYRRWRGLGRHGARSSCCP